MNKHHVLIRALHWLMAFGIFVMLLLGFLMDTRDQYMLHKSIGISLIILFVIRLLVRILTKTPIFPKEIKAREIVLAKLGHLGLYVLMICMPISGWLMSSFGGHPVKLFGLEVFALVEKNKEFGKLANEAHELIAYALIFMISLHVLAVVKHKIVDKVNLLKRIM